MSERTRQYYPRPVFEKRVKELTAYKGSSSVIFRIKFTFESREAN